MHAAPVPSSAGRTLPSVQALPAARFVEKERSCSLDQAKSIYSKTS